MQHTLVVVAHGTRDPRGQHVTAELAQRVRTLTNLPVHLAFVDVQEPRLDTVLQSTANSVVVPLLLSTGYHVRIDIPRAVASTSRSALLAPPLGPDGTLVDILDERLRSAGAASGDTVVLAAAGSSDPRAAIDVEQVARRLGDRRGVVAEVGYTGGQRPSVEEAVATARGAGARRLAVATYLVAPGLFLDRIARAGADVVSDPLGAHPRLAELVVRRCRRALDRSGTFLLTETAASPPRSDDEVCLSQEASGKGEPKCPLDPILVSTSGWAESRP